MIKITKKENSNESLIKWKNSDVTSEINLYLIEKETIEKDYIKIENTGKPKEKNSPSKNQNPKNYEIENKKSPLTNIALQNFDFDNETKKK